MTVPPAARDFKNCDRAAKDAAEIRACLREANDGGERFVVRGTGSRGAIDPASGASVLSIARHAGIVDLDPEEMVLTAEAGTSIVEIAAVLAPHRLYLPPLLAAPAEASGGTLGGLYSDPRESPLWPRLGRTRDHALGIEAVRGDATPFKAGGRVVKNVTGYDLTRFLCGARGRYAVITRLHWRLLPAPEAVLAARYRFPGFASAWRGLEALRRAGHEPLLAALDAGKRQPAPADSPRAVAFAVIVECGRAEVAPMRIAAAAKLLGGEEVEAPRARGRGVARARGAGAHERRGDPRPRAVLCVAGPPRNAGPRGGRRALVGESVSIRVLRTRLVGAAPRRARWRPRAAFCVARGVRSERERECSARSGRGQRSSARASVRAALARALGSARSPLGRPPMTRSAGPSHLPTLLDCVHCGLCLPECPTYRVTGREAESPRGRIAALRALTEGRAPATAALRALTEGRAPATAALREGLADCLVCRACESACPAGISMERLMGGYRSAEPPRALDFGARLERWALRALIARPARLRAAAALLRLAAPLVRGLPFGADLPSRARLNSPAPLVAPPPDPRAPARGTAVIFQGCVAAHLFRAETNAAAAVLARNGWRVAFSAPGCCGALHRHAGLLDDARALERNTAAAIAAAAPAPTKLAGTAGPVVVDAAGCAAALADPLARSDGA
ncbi:MAG: FAD-binding protein, partial [Planctomycetes bacterium]|nr:FAD-binding protein [Planctomycetota bacterium]